MKEADDLADGSVDLLAEIKEIKEGIEEVASFVEKLPPGISWPDSLESVMSAEEVKELYTQIANKAIDDFLGTPYWILFQFESPKSISFGIQSSQVKPSNEALQSVLSRIVDELQTLRHLEIEDQRNMAMQEAMEAQMDAESELVDGNGIVVLRPNREQKRHPEKFGLTRRQKRGINANP